MGTQTSLMVLQLTRCLGFALWPGPALIDDLQALASSVGAIDITMSMVPLVQPPATGMPLLARAVCSPLIYRLALSIIVALQVATVITAWADRYELLFGAGLETARSQLDPALNAALGFLFGVLLGGLWFSYWIHQERL